MLTMRSVFHSGQNQLKPLMDTIYTDLGSGMKSVILVNKDYLVQPKTDH